MAETKIKYVRKLSGEEALKRYILVLKESLKLFPKPGVVFKIKIGDQVLDSQINVVETWSTGARKPNLRYHIDLSHHVDLYRPHFGHTISLTKVSDSTFELIYS